MRRLLIAVASLVAEHGLYGVWDSVVAAHGLSSCRPRALEHRLSSCGARALLLRSMWDLPGPGLEPGSTALAGGFLTTVPPGKPRLPPFLCEKYYVSSLFEKLFFRILWFTAECKS